MAAGIHCHRYCIDNKQALLGKNSHAFTSRFPTQQHNPLLLYKNNSHTSTYRPRLLSPMASASSSKEVATEILPYIRVYKDGTVERLLGSPTVPPSPDPDPETGVSSKDITISVLNHTTIPARLYLPDLTQNQNQKLPILIYFHGGGFCIESSFSLFTHRYLSRLVSEAKVVAVSVEFSLAPENPLPAAYDDGWVALRWAAFHSTTDTEGFNKELWLINHGDFGRLYIGGDSSGANISHNIAIRAGNESLPGGVKLLGAFLGVPYFLGSKPIGSEPIEGFEKSFSYVLWNFVYPSAPGGVDNPKLNPLVAGAPSLAGLGCSRLLVVVAENDELRDRGVWYCNGVRESGWEGELELFETEGPHASHIFQIDTEIGKNVIKRIASFLV